MNSMKLARFITIHHDGMKVFTETSKSAAAARLEKIRTSHLKRDNGSWGDIGYHYAIDRAGRLWEGRSLKWQGAHVKGWNEGNIGVVVLGNYDKQTLNRAQSARIETTLKLLMKKHNVPVSRVRTHQEWAATACPGNSLQRLMTTLRRSALKKV
jgi:N-acetyl-anhydromuramyl-L-alanine amidase AmpD